jgi:hypothetical protein
MLRAVEMSAVSALLVVAIFFPMNRPMARDRCRACEKMPRAGSEITSAAARRDDPLRGRGAKLLPRVRLQGRQYGEE